MTRDKYDDAIDYLTENPDEIYHVWGLGSQDRGRINPAPGSVLFNIVGRDGCGGCLTQIRARADHTPRQTPLIEAIRSDHRIPYHSSEIQVRHLRHFAEWQRKIDALDAADSAGVEA
jgi:hypothetical protein